MSQRLRSMRQHGVCSRDTPAILYHRSVKWEAGSGRNYKAEDLRSKRILEIFKYHSEKFEFCHE